MGGSSLLSSETFDRWLSEVDANTASVLESGLENLKELEDAFYRNLVVSVKTSAYST